MACGWVEHLDEEQRRRVTELGVPLRGEATAADGGQMHDPAVTFRVSDLDVHPETAGQFSIPVDFVDLRTSGARPPTTYRYTGPYDRTSPAQRRHRTGRRADPGAGRPRLRSPRDLAMPSCVGATYGAALATRFERLLLDDVQMMLNAATASVPRF